jgi:hypothetical protein
MQGFDCCFIDKSGRVVFRAYVDAEDLEAAKHAAFNILYAAPAPSSCQVRGLEIWKGDCRLYPVSDMLRV